MSRYIYILDIGYVFCVGGRSPTTVAPSPTPSLLCLVEAGDWSLSRGLQGQTHDLLAEGLAGPHSQSLSIGVSVGGERSSFKHPHTFKQPQLRAQTQTSPESPRLSRSVEWMMLGRVDFFPKIFFGCFFLHLNWRSNGHLAGAVTFSRLLVWKPCRFSRPLQLAQPYSSHEAAGINLPGISMQRQAMWHRPYPVPAWLCCSETHKTAAVFACVC